MSAYLSDNINMHDGSRKMVKSPPPFFFTIVQSAHIEVVPCSKDKNTKHFSFTALRDESGLNW